MKGMVVIVSLLLTGCSAPALMVNCLDEKIPRPDLDVGSYQVTLSSPQYNFKKTQIIQCEKYYDAHCSVSGNRWRYRTKNKIEKAELTIDEITAKVSYPSCEQLAKNKKPSISIDNLGDYFDSYAEKKVISDKFKKAIEVSVVGAEK